MILIGIGANLPHPCHGSPRETCDAALTSLQQNGVTVTGRSRWFKSAPVPPSDQPWFVNGVASLETALSPGGLLAVLHEVEESFGRRRRVRNEARVLDLDLLAYAERVSAPGESPALPHPRLTERAFVIVPLADLAPAWRHPVSGKSALDYCEDLKGVDSVMPLDVAPSAG